MTGGRTATQKKEKKRRKKGAPARLVSGNGLSQRARRPKLRLGHPQRRKGGRGGGEEGGGPVRDTHRRARRRGRQPSPLEPRRPGKDASPRRASSAPGVPGGPRPIHPTSLPAAGCAHRIPPRRGRGSGGSRIMEAAAGRTHRRQVACAGRDREGGRSRTGTGSRPPGPANPPPRQRPPPPGAPFVRGAGGVSGDGRAVRPGLAGRARVCSGGRRRGVGDAAPGTRPPAAPPRPRPAAPLTSPLPASVPQAARNRRRLMPMVAETWSAASKPGPAAAAGPPGPGAAPPPPLPAAPPEHGPPRSPSPAVAGAAAGSAGRRLCTAGTRRRDPPGPRRPQPPLPGRAGKRHRPLCAIFTERRRARERGRAAPRALHSASPARGGAA